MRNVFCFVGRLSLCVHTSMRVQCFLEFGGTLMKIKFCFLWVFAGCTFPDMCLSSSVRFLKFLCLPDGTETDVGASRSISFKRLSFERLWMCIQCYFSPYLFVTLIYHLSCSEFKALYMTLSMLYSHDKPVGYIRLRQYNWPKVTWWASAKDLNPRSPEF